MELKTQTIDKQIVLKAIDSLGRHVTPADVASKTGMPLLPVTATLNQIAAETEGHMEVSDKGEVAYRFAPGFQGKYALKGFQEALKRVGDIVFKVGFFIIRISFGVMLIINALIILLLVLVVILYYQQRSGDRDDDGGSYGGGFFPFRLSFFDYLLLRDILFYPSYYSYGTRNDYHQPTIRKNPQSNFFFNAFSFLFGDGNPNQNMEERKWSMIAEVIRRNHGVVTSEQLSPYLGSDPNNDDAVLPALVRFDGRPEVTDDGDIVYVFPAMQVTAMETPWQLSLPTYLSEWTWKFTNVAPGQMVMVYVLAGFNFLGSLFLLMQMQAMEFSRYGNPLADFAPLIHFLVISATLFIVVPFCRWIVINFLNGSISERNEKRLSNARMLENPPDNVLKKLANAQKMHVDKKVISHDNTIFTTERDSLEQEFDASP